MVVSPSDISFVYSGGLSNNDPNASLGGDPSSFPIIDSINNLFDNIEPQESESGDEEYRAFYIFNDNASDSFSDAKIWVESEIDLGARVELGVNLTDEVQRMIITPDVDITGGSFKIEITYQLGVATVTETSNNVFWNSDFDVLAQNIETALNGLNLFSEVQVEKVGSAAIFDITFQGNDGNKAQPTLIIAENMLTSSGDPAEIEVNLLTQGSPINRIAPDIGTENISPSGISFTTSDSDSPITIGKLDAGQGFPIWVKRIVPANTEGQNLDGFTLRLQGSSGS